VKPIDDYGGGEQIILRNVLYDLGIIIHALSINFCIFAFHFQWREGE
jgi:hypothetical protein